LHIDFKYGESYKSLNIEEKNIIKRIYPLEKKGSLSPEVDIENKLSNPVLSPSLAEMLSKKSPEQIKIIINDITRPTPYNIMLPPLLNVLHDYGLTNDQISFIIATGVHPPHSLEQDIKVLGENIVENYEVKSHNCDENVVKVKELSSGNPLYVNKDVLNADFIITTGVIMPHYFAGFSGGRKSILPGVSGRTTIENNHSHMVELIDMEEVKLENNPVNQEMMEAAEIVGIDFILNVVTNSRREIVEVVAGDWKEAWLEGVKVSKSLYEVEVEEKSDLTIVSCGGYPRDINIYQSQKALDHADRVTKEGGIIILITESQECYGDETFEQWITAADTPEDVFKKIKEKFVIGGHKAFAIAKVVKDKQVLVVSEITEAEAENMFFKKFSDLTQAYEYAKGELGEDFKVNIIPNGSTVVPKVRK